MIFNKNISLGISLLLEMDDYIEIFEKYRKNIKEVYFSVPAKKKYIQSRTEIYEQYKDAKNKEKIIEILKLAKKYDIKIELAINSFIGITEEDIEEMFNWCTNNNIEVDKVVTLNNLVDVCYNFFGDIEYCYSYNNNIINHNFLDDINPLFSEVVIGNRSLRDVELFKKIHDKNLKIKLLLDNGCHHNCYWCSTGYARSCKHIAKKNREKYSINFLLAIQSVFPYEVFEYYSLFNIDSYKLSTRVLNKFSFYNTLHYYINNIRIKCLDDFLFTCKLGSLFESIEEKKDEIDFYKITKIKDTIWEDIIGKNINSNFK